MNNNTSSSPGLGLLVDDDGLYLRTLQRSLSKRGIQTVLAQSFNDALAAAEVHRPQFALIDLRLGSSSGLGLIEPLLAVREDMRILLVTGYASIATAVEAVKRGAENYLMKPVSADAIVRVLVGEPETPRESAHAMVPLARLEWEHIQQALNETNGNISAAARLLGMHRRSLQRKLAKRPAPERKNTDSLQ
jgi:two-component system, response regulator RegA